MLGACEPQPKMVSTATGRANDNPGRHAELAVSYLLRAYQSRWLSCTTRPKKTMCRSQVRDGPNPVRRCIALSSHA